MRRKPHTIPSKRGGAIAKRLTRQTHKLSIGPWKRNRSLQRKDRIEKITNAIDNLNPFEEKKDYFATSILSESVNLQFDSEGRILLTNKLLKHAKIKTSMVFVGQGKTFQIWEPTLFEKFKVTARKKSNINRSSLKWEQKLNN